MNKSEIEILNEIEARWDERSLDFTKPRIFYGLYNNRRYVTSSDDTTIFHFVSDKGKVYGATKSNCKISSLEGIDIYWIEDDKFQQFSCKKPYRPVDFFVKESIVPIYFKAR